MFLMILLSNFNSQSMFSCHNWLLNKTFTLFNVFVIVSYLYGDYNLIENIKDGWVAQREASKTFV